MTNTQGTPTDSHARFAVALSLLSLSGAAVSLVMIRPPAGLWVGVYSHYWPTWLWLLASAGCLIAAIHRVRVPWIAVLGWGLLAASIATLISHEWGVPYTHHDVWTQLSYARFGVFDGAKNPYPSLHALTNMLVELTGVSHDAIFSTGNLLTVSLGVVTACVFIRSLPFSERGQQLAFIAGLPAWLLGLTFRPITLAWPVVFLLLWVMMSDRVAASWEMKVLSGLLLVASPFLHPQLTLFLFIFLASTWTVTVGLQRTAMFDGRPPLRPASLPQPVVLCLLLGVILTAYLSFYTNALPLAALSLFKSTIASTTSAPTSGAEQSVVKRLLSNPELLAEAVRRLSFLLVATGAATVAVGLQLRDREVETRTLGLLVGGGAIAVVFLVLEVKFNARIASVSRVLVLLPAVAIIGAARAFDTYRAASVLLAFCVLLSGGLMLYPAGLNGKVGLSPTTAQTEGVQWVSEYRGGQHIVGTTSTFWLAEGLYGPAELTDWTDYNVNPKRIPKYRDNRYSWQVSSPPESLVVVDGISRAIARTEAAETGDAGVIESLHESRSRCKLIYDNRDTRIYTCPRD